MWAAAIPALMGAMGGSGSGGGSAAGPDNSQRTTINVNGGGGGGLFDAMKATPAPDYSKPIIIGVGVLALAAVLIFALKR